MADKTIIDLSEAGAIISAEAYLPIDDGIQTFKINCNAMAKAIRGLPTMIPGVASTVVSNGVYIAAVGGQTFSAQASPQTGEHIRIKDVNGTFGTTPSSFVPSGSQKVDGVAATYSLNVNYGSWEFLFDGTDWVILDKPILMSSGEATVTIAGATGSPTWNSSFNKILWRRHNDVVFLAGKLKVNVEPTGGVLQIAGLPFNATKNCAVTFVMTSGVSEFNAQSVMARIPEGTNYILVEYFKEGDIANGAVLLTENAEWAVGGSYIVS